MKQRISWLLLILGAGYIDQLADATTFTVSSDSQTFTLDGDYFLTGASSIFGAYSSLIIDTGTGQTKNVTIDGAGHTIWAAPTTTTKTIQKVGGPKLFLTLTNCKFRNFDPVFTQNLPNFNIYIGDGTYLYYDYDYTMSRGSNFNVVGTATINLQGNTLTNNSGTGIVDLVNSSSRLAIKNGTFRSVAADFAGSSSLGGTLKFADLRIIVEPASVQLDYQSTSNYANVEIGGNVKISGKHPTTIGSELIYYLKSAGTFTVLSDSMLQIERGIQLNYQPYSPTGVGYTLYASKRKLRLLDLSSKLFLDGGTLTTTATGLALDRGNLIVDGLANININNATTSTLDLGSALVVDILPSATLKLNGPVNYDTTSP